MSQLKGFRITVSGFDVVFFEAAENPRQAKHSTWASAREAGFRVGHGEITVQHLPALDALACDGPKRELGALEAGEVTGELALHPELFDAIGFGLAGAAR